MTDRVVGFVIALAFGVLLYVISQSKSKRFLERLDKKSTFREKQCEDLTALYRKLDFNEFPYLFERIMELPENGHLKKFVILRKYLMDERRILFITKYVEPYPDVRQSRSIETHIYYFKFLIKKNLSKSQFEFYSDLYKGLTDKNLRMDFKDELLNILKTSNV